MFCERAYPALLLYGVVSGSVFANPSSNHGMIVPMWIDTHLHLDASEFDDDRDDVIARALGAGVSGFLIPAVERKNFLAVQSLAKHVPGAVYTLGIHPMYIMQADEADIDVLRSEVRNCIGDSKFAGIGEIGLDGFVAGLDMARQQFFFEEQIKIAVQFGLPVVMHVRRAQDLVLKTLRKYKPTAGIAHAFNGSLQQAEQFIGLNCVLGFGGALTFERALQIRRLAATIGNDALVLETDSPDIPPAWANGERNEPAELPEIANTLAEVRNIPLSELAALTSANAKRIIPALSVTA